MRKIYRWWPLLMLLVFTACSTSVSSDETEPHSIHISFALQTTTHVEIWVENSYETRMLTLVDTTLPAGNHLASFRPVDDQGAPWPEGLYSYCIKTSEYFDRGEMVLAY